MSSTYVFPGGQNTYVPGLTADLIVEYTRNVADFPLMRYAATRSVDKMVAYYVKDQNLNQMRIVDINRSLWADGADLPEGNVNNDPFEFLPYQCKRYAQPSKLGYLAVEQAGWDELARITRKRAQQSMTGRTQRALKVLTTSGNWPAANTSTCTALVGGKFTAATSTNPYISQAVQAMAIQIQLETGSAVKLQDLHFIVNPNTAKAISTSAEWIDFIKQSPEAARIWTGDGEWSNSKYNLPNMIFGMKLTVEDSVVVTSEVGISPATYSFILPDGVALVLTKPMAIATGNSASFSTFEVFLYEDFSTYVFNDVRNKRYDVYVSDNTAEVLVAPESGFYLTACI